MRRDFNATRSAAINRQELQQVRVNLLVNAIQARPEGGTLALGSADWRDEAGHEGVEITLADTGPGLPADLLATLFQPFVTRKQDGTGLGLWISRGLLERYGGAMAARWRRDQRGQRRGRGCGVQTASAQQGGLNRGAAAACQVAFETLMVGNLAEKSFALSAIFTATLRATAL